MRSTIDPTLRPNEVLISLEKTKGNRGTWRRVGRHQRHQICRQGTREPGVSRDTIGGGEARARRSRGTYGALDLAVALVSAVAGLNLIAGEIRLVTLVRRREALKKEEHEPKSVESVDKCGKPARGTG